MYQCENSSFIFASNIFLIVCELLSFSILLLHSMAHKIGLLYDIVYVSIYADLILSTFINSVCIHELKSKLNNFWTIGTGISSLKIE